jgi:hypothetical protein
MEGTLLLEVINADLYRDIEMIGSMDPVAKFKLYD